MTLNNIASLQAALWRCEAISWLIEEIASQKTLAMTCEKRLIK